MTILQLWHALLHPSLEKHPVFRRIAQEPHPMIKLPVRVLVGGSILSGMLIICGLSYVMPSNLLRVMALLPVILPLLYILLIIGGTGKGVTLTGKISAALAQEYEQDTFEVLSTQPGGALGIYWAVMTGYLHREADLENTTNMQRQITGWLFALVTFLLIVLYLNAWTRRAMDAFVNLTYVLYPLVAIYYIDYVAAIITGTLCGAVAATIAARRAESRVLGVSLFLTLQFAGYLLTYFLAVQALPQIFQWLGFEGMLARFSLASLSVIIYFVVREVITLLLWRLLLWQLHTAPVEYEAVL